MRCSFDGNFSGNCCIWIRSLWINCNHHPSWQKTQVHISRTQFLYWFVTNVRGVSIWAVAQFKGLSIKTTLKSLWFEYWRSYTGNNFSKNKNIVNSFKNTRQDIINPILTLHGNRLQQLRSLPVPYVWQTFDTRFQCHGTGWTTLQRPCIITITTPWWYDLNSILHKSISTAGLT